MGRCATRSRSCATRASFMSSTRLLVAAISSESLRVPPNRNPKAHEAPTIAIIIVTNIAVSIDCFLRCTVSILALYSRGCHVVSSSTIAYKKLCRNFPLASSLQYLVNFSTKITASHCRSTLNKGGRYHAPPDSGMPPSYNAIK